MPTPFARTWLHRFLAAGAAALVLALAVLTACPALHHALHADDGALATDDGCVVATYAGGVALDTPLAVLAPVALSVEVGPTRPEPTLYLVPTRYLRQPERGPPANRVS